MRLLAARRGFDDAAAEGASPEAVGDGDGEAGIVFGSQPVSEGFTGAVEFFEIGHGAEDDFGFDEVTGFAVGIGVVVRKFEDEFWVIGDAVLGGVHEALHGLLLDAVITAVFDGCLNQIIGWDERLSGGGAFRIQDVAIGEGSGAAEEGGEVVELALGPIVEGVIVALSAGKVGAEEVLRGEGEVVQGHAGVAHEVTCGGVFLVHAIGGDHFPDHEIIGFVFGDVGFEPFDVGGAADVLGDACFEAEEVGVEVEEVAVMAGGFEEGVDQGDAFVAGFVFEEGAGFGELGDAACDVEVGTADELLVGEIGVGFDFL